MRARFKGRSLEDASLTRQPWHRRLSRSDCLCACWSCELHKCSFSSDQVQSSQTVLSCDVNLVRRKHGPRRKRCHQLTRCEMLPKRNRCLACAATQHPPLQLFCPALFTVQCKEGTITTFLWSPLIPCRKHAAGRQASCTLGRQQRRKHRGWVTSQYTLKPDAHHN